ncbi:MAG: lipocalin-like domain-containing protein [Sneathiella sp.]
MTRKKNPQSLLGTWRLKDWHSLKNGDFYAYPMGEDVQGQLIYTAAGRMSGFLMRADFGEEAPRSDTKAAKSLSYGGNWRIEGEDVVHEVDLSTIPEWIGTELVRTMVWQGDELLLKTAPQEAPDGNRYENRLLWERQREG